MSTVSQANPARAMNRAAVTLPSDSQVPTAGLPAQEKLLDGIGTHGGILGRRGTRFISDAGDRGQDLGLHQLDRNFFDATRAAGLNCPAATSLAACVTSLSTSGPRPEIRSMMRLSSLSVLASRCTVLTLAAPASAQTWTGSTSGSWSNAANWSPAAVPASSQNTVS